MQQLIFDFFGLCNLEPVEIRKGVWQVQAGDALMKELDGWRAQGRLLQFTFDQRSAEIYGADLICTGSYRLNSILQVLRRQGILSQAHIPHHYFHEPGIRKKIISGFSLGERVYIVNCALRYAQYLQWEVLVEASGLQKKESIHSVVVDLSSGKVLKHAFPYHLLKAGGVPTDMLVKRRCSFKQAYNNAATHIQDIVETDDYQWALDARSKLAQEEVKLNTFFAGRTSSDEYKAKLLELQQRLAPIVRIDALRGALLLIPLFQYRLMIVDADGHEKSKNLMYDPVGNLHLQGLD